MSVGAAGRVVQVNVAPQGGLPKRPVPQARVTTLGLEGDAQADTKHHGGPRQAVLVIGQEWLDTLAGEGFAVFPGALGENLTTRGLDLALLPVGAQIRAGEALLEVTKPRQPCRTIHPFGGPALGKRIYDARVQACDATAPLWGASGLYCRVLREGVVRAGDAVGPP
jgi:MOSC domain-containing protein YiiM